MFIIDLGVCINFHVITVNGSYRVENVYYKYSFFLSNLLILVCHTKQENFLILYELVIKVFFDPCLRYRREDYDSSRVYIFYRI